MKEEEKMIKDSEKERIVTKKRFSVLMRCTLLD